MESPQSFQISLWSRRRGPYRSRAETAPRLPVCSSAMSVVSNVASTSALILGHRCASVNHGVLRHISAQRNRLQTSRNFAISKLIQLSANLLSANCQQIRPRMVTRWRRGSRSLEHAIHDASSGSQCSARFSMRLSMTLPPIPNRYG